jgi:UPF0755 protein
MRSMRCVRLLATIALAGLVAACGADMDRCNLGRGNTSRSVTVPAGATLKSATDSLARVGLLESPNLFRIYASARGRARNIKPGVYRFACADASWSKILHRLSLGPDERKITIPEGLALRDIIPILARATGDDPESLWAAARDTALLHELQVPTSTLEGYLFPDTYQIAYGTSAAEVVGQMVNRFEDVWESEWDAQLQQLAMSRHDIITLASIIEKEARLDEERPVISAVYHNRLRDGMPLQADPTVQYARGEHTDRVLYKDLEIDSPYNTYRNSGLPPGPIASPGRASIVAALFPANVPYRFFVAHPDGHHEFRVTYREHEAARAEIRRERARGGRADSPASAKPGRAQPRG